MQAYIVTGFPGRACRAAALGRGLGYYFTIERVERLAKDISKVKKSDIVRHGTITHALKRELDIEKVPEPKKPRKRRS